MRRTVERYESHFRSRVGGSRLCSTHLPSLAVDAAFLHAAKGRYLGRDDALVDADDAAFEPLGHTPDAADVATIEISGQPPPFPPPLAGEGRVGVSLAILMASSSVLKR